MRDERLAGSAVEGDKSASSMGCFCGPEPGRVLKMYLTSPALGVRSVRRRAFNAASVIREPARPRQDWKSAGLLVYSSTDPRAGKYEAKIASSCEK